MKTLLKDNFIEIKNTFKRFISILLIVLLGVGFFAGIKATSPDMKNTIDAYFDDKNVMDFTIISTMGITDEDIQAVKTIEEVQNVVPAYSKDVMVKISEENCVVKLHSITPEINQLNLIEGRMPENSKECLVEEIFLKINKIKIGDKINIEQVNEEESYLKDSEITIVGVVESPLYISKTRGSTKLGSGTIDYFIYISEENINQEAYTELYITLKDTKGVKCYSDTYKDTINFVKNKIETVSAIREKERYEEIIQEANKKIEEAENELLDKKQEVKNEFNSAERKINNAKKNLKSYISKIENAEKQLLSSEQELSKQEEIFKITKQQLLLGISQAEDTIQNLKALLNSPGQDVDSLNKQMSILESKIIEYNSTIKNTEKIFADSRIEIEKGKQELETQKVEVNKQIKSGEKEIAKNESKLKEKKQEAEEEFLQAEEKINEAKDKIKDIKQPIWYILDRESNVGYAGFIQDSDRIDNIGKVFPIVFFVVAALISLTTMTRMVEEQRIEIGTLKALGYNKVQIAFKYINYAFLATVTGAIIGMLIGFDLLPKIIFNMYAMMYTMPKLITEFNVYYALVGLLVATACTIGATIFSCIKELKQHPATLMRPKSPRPGKRVLLENITFIWSKLKFTQKVTVRNIFRYKKRFLMTIIGIMGCTSLILAGFGLRDSISNMIPSQYGEIFKYDMSIELKSKLSKEEYNNTINKISNFEEITEILKLNIQAISIEEDTKNQTIQLIVPEDINKLNDFIELKSRTKDEYYKLDDSSVIITEKLADLLNVKKGYVIKIKNSDDIVSEVKISEVTENYLLHYIYMSPQLYEQLYKEPVTYNTIFTKNNNLSIEHEEILGKNILSETSNISSLSFTSATKNIFNDVMNNLTFVVWILIISAGLLAFVVLYNLSNTNISERIRELATIKVLGFYDKETYNYVNRETIILTIIGIILGLVMGYFLNVFIMKTCELDILMFDKRVEIPSYIYAIMITAFFTAIVNIVTYFYLKKINMIDSLKSIE